MKLDCLLSDLGTLMWRDNVICLVVLGSKAHPTARWPLS